MPIIYLTGLDRPGIITPSASGGGLIVSIESVKKPGIRQETLQNTPFFRRLVIERFADLTEPPIADRIPRRLRPFEELLA